MRQPCCARLRTRIDCWPTWPTRNCKLLLQTNAHAAQAAAPLGRELERLVGSLAAAAAEQRAWRSERQALQARAAGLLHELLTVQGFTPILRMAFRL